MHAPCCTEHHLQPPAHNDGFKSGHGELQSKKPRSPALWYLRRYAEMLLAEQPDPSDIVALTRHQIERLLGDGKAELQTVAGELQISLRTLRSKLAKATVNFSGLLDEVRAHRARYYLKETEMQITEVAFLLGFSELSSFTRATSRWLGMSPRANRRLQQELDTLPAGANRSDATSWVTSSTGSKGSK